jgi:NitT/TauT family transport system ATP-binding protein
LLLLDEPFAALDEITRQRLDEQLRELWISRKMTVVFVTHSTSEAVFLANRAVVLSKRPGRIVHDSLIDLPTHRVGLLRGSQEFAAQTRGIYESLEKGGS